MAPKHWTDSFFDEDYVRLLRAQNPPAKTRTEVDFIVRALRIKPPARILDVACGYGRHSVELARRGFEVVGVDAASAMIAAAKKQLKRTSPLSFELGDMRRLSYRDEFDAVINMFTSFGYYTHRGNVAALKRLARALRPGGRLLVDSPDPDEVIERISRSGEIHRTWHQAGGARYVMEEIRLDAECEVIHNRWRMLKRDTRNKKLWNMTTRSFRLQIYRLARWDEMLAECGLRRTRVFGGYTDAEPANGLLRRQILIASNRP